MTTFFLRDPRLLVLALATILVSGGISFVVMPRMEDPNLTDRAAIVNTRLLGANADRVESLVSSELVERLRSIEEIKELRSTSRQSLSSIAVILRDEVTQVDEVWARIRDKLTDARPFLPAGTFAPDLKIVRARAYSYIASLKWNPSQPPSLSLLRRQANDLQDLMRGVASTEQVDTFGEPEEEIIVEVSPESLSSVGLNVAALNRLIAANDPKVSAGSLRTASSDMLVQLGNELDSVTRVGNLIVRSGEAGESLTLSDIGEIQKSVVDPPRSIALVEGQRAIMVAATINPTARVDIWTDDLEKRLDEFREQLPASLELSCIFRQNDIVAARIQSLMINLLVSAITVVAVVFLMMGWRGSIIVGLTLPLATLMVFTGLRLLDIPLHQMSLSALVIALGMLEGTAIVIVDDVQRRLRQGESPMDALSHGVSHMALPLMGSTLTTVLSFTPIAIMPGPTGEFVGAIGSAVILALFCSLILSLSIIPSLAALFPPPASEESGFLNQGYSNAWMSKIYRGTLLWCFERPWLGLMMGVAVCIPGFFLIPLLPEQFFPAADRGQFHIEIDSSAQASIQQTEEIAQKIRERLLRHSNISRVDWVIGESIPSFYYNVIGSMKDNARYAQALVQLKNGMNARDLIRELQDELDSEIPEAMVRVRQLEQGPPFDAPIEIRWFGPDSGKLRDLGDQTRQLLAQHPLVIHTQSDLTDSVAKVVLDIDEAAAARAGLSLNSIAEQLDSAMEGGMGGSVLEASEQLPTRVRLRRQDRSNIGEMESIELYSDRMNESGPTPLSSLGTTRISPEVSSISKLDGRKMNEVRGYIVAGVLPSTVLQWFQQKRLEGAIDIPKGYTMELGGEASKRDEAVGQLSANIGLIAMAMICVLVFSLKSFRASAVIVGVGGLSVGFGIFGLWIAGFPMGFTAIVGAMGMIGVAINDSIVVLADLRSDPQSAKGDLQTVLDIVMRSTRHVLATTFTVAVGFIPLVMEGGTFWPPMAMVISAGVIGATVVALYSVPSVHLLLIPRSKRLAS